MTLEYVDDVLESGGGGNPAAVLEGLDDADADLIRRGAAEYDAVLKKADAVGDVVIAPARPLMQMPKIEPTPVERWTGPIQTQQEAQGERIARETVIFELRITLPSITRPLPPEFDTEALEPALSDFATGDEYNAAYAKWQAKSKADKKMIRRKKYIIDPVRLKAAQQLVAKHRDFLRSVCVPTSLLRGGMYMAPLVFLDKIEEAQKTFETDFAAIAIAFTDIWESEIVPEGQELLKGDYNPLDYKSADAIRESFTVKARYLSFNAPQALENLNKDIYQREKLKAERQWDEAGAEIRTALRETFAELVTRLSASLQPTADGKPRRLYDTAVTNLQDFIAVFDGRNLTNDADLQALVSKARALTNGVSPDALRKTDGMLRARVSEQIASIGESISKLVVVANARAIATDDCEL